MPATVQSAPRLLSLDVLRGVTVAFMILVNNAGDGAVSYAQLRHSVWNGCTLTDLVFPTFLFVVGASVVLAFQRKLDAGVRAWALLPGVVRRSLLLLGLGLLINALPTFHLGELRYFGVLQRIAVCYLLAALLYLAGGVRLCAVVCALLLVGYWYLMTRVALPEFGMPGVTVPVLDRAGNLASLIDRMLVPPAHLYHHTVYDPEGLLSTLPALGTTLMGVCAATWLSTARDSNAKAALLLGTAALMLAVALLWAPSFPFNKRLWTSSFALLTGGFATALLSVLYWLIDGPPHLRRGLTPWLMLGTNALAAYVLSEVLAIVIGAVHLPSGLSVQRWLYQLLPPGLGSPAFGSLVYSLLFVLVCAVPVALLYRRRIFLKL